MVSESRRRQRPGASAPRVVDAAAAGTDGFLASAVRSTGGKVSDQDRDEAAAGTDKPLALAVRRSGGSATDRGRDEAARREKLAQHAAISLAPMVPLQLLSPWSGLALATAPPAPPTLQQMMNMPKEEEQFAELIFPGFDGNAFIWQITCWQVLEFAFSMVLGHSRANPTPCVLYRLGASWGPAIARGQLWRLLGPVTLHANLTHLLFNVFFQLRMGFGMEKQFGRDKMMLIYFGCGTMGNLMSVIIDPYKLAVGASTAGFGLIGVWLAEIALSWEILGPARERTIIWIALMLVSVTTMSTMTPNMDLYGHLGGALGGFLLSILISDMREDIRPEWYSQARVSAAVALILFLTGGLGKVMLFGPRDPIPDCPLFSLGAAAAAPMAAALTTAR